MARLSLEKYQKIRAGLANGRIRVGSGSHIQVIDRDLQAKDLSKRDRLIIRLAIKGWTHAAIADHVDLSRSRTSEIIAEFVRRDFHAKQVDKLG